MCIRDSSLTIGRSVFVNRLKLMSGIRHRLLVITAPLTQVKAPYPQPGNPNRIFQSLIAVLAGIKVPFLCTDTHELGEEAVASYLYQVHLYHWLETLSLIHICEFEGWLGSRVLIPTRLQFG